MKVIIRFNFVLIITLVGLSSEEETSEFIHHIFRLVRKGVIYVPEACLETFREIPECIDVYMMKNVGQMVIKFYLESLKKFSLISKLHRRQIYRNIQLE